MKCVKCGAEMKKAIASAATGGKLMISDPAKKNFLGVMEASEINAYVCPKCGYIEFYADNPAKFKGNE